MPNNLNRLIKAFRNTGFDVELCDYWDENYYLVTISNPNQEDDYYQLCFDKQTGKYASYVNGRYFIEA